MSFSIIFCISVSSSGMFVNFGCQLLAAVFTLGGLQYTAPPRPPPIPPPAPQRPHNTHLDILPDDIVSALLSTKKTRKVQDEQTRDLILNVLEVCKEECIKNGLLIPFSGVRARVAMYTGINESTVRNIRKADQLRRARGQIRQPLLQIKRARSIKTVLDDRDIIKIKNIIRDHYIEHRKVPVIRQLLPVILDQIPTYQHRVSFLNKIIKSIGYKRKKYYSKRSVLLEDPSVMAYRYEYLKCVKQLKADAVEKIFYVYECVVDRSLTLHKSWVQKYGYNGSLRDKNTYSFICAGSVNGFLKNSLLLRRNDFGKETGSHPGQLSAVCFEKWLKKFLLPYLPPNSIVIMDDGPHHCVEEDISISYYSHKSDMCNYLKHKNISCDENMRRSELYKLIELNKPKQRVFVVDNILKQNGHRGIRLPPHMVDLSPIQHGMDLVQQKLFDQESSRLFNIRNLGEILGKLMATVTQEEWNNFFDKVATLEDETWKKDEEYEVAIDEVIFSLRDCIDNDSEESDFDSESEDLKM